MSFSCYFGRLPNSVLKGEFSSVLGALSKRFFTTSSSVCIAQPLYLPSKHKNQAENHRNRSLLKHGQNSVSLLPAVKEFGTTSSLLAQHKAHDHSKLWTLERVLSGALLPLVPAALVYPSPALDTAMAVLIVLHTHFGLEAIVVDYVRPILFGEVAPKIALGLLYLFSAFTLAGLLNLIYNDIGLANTILAIWKK